MVVEKQQQKKRHPGLFEHQVLTAVTPKCCLLNFSVYLWPPMQKNVAWSYGNTYLEHLVPARAKFTGKETILRSHVFAAPLTTRK